MLFDSEFDRSVSADDLALEDRGGAAFWTVIALGALFVGCIVAVTFNG